MSDNKIYEITQMMHDRNLIESDVNHAAELVRSMFVDKYIKPMSSAIKEHDNQVLQNPSNEIRLMLAMKPFFPPEKHASIDNIIGMFHQIDSFKRMRSQLSPFQRAMPQPPLQNRNPFGNSGSMYNRDKPISNMQRPPEQHDENTESVHYIPEEIRKNPDPSIHKDGIYEIDNQCLNDRNNPSNLSSMHNLFMMAALMGKNNH